MPNLGDRMGNKADLVLSPLQSSRKADIKKKSNNMHDEYSEKEVEALTV